MREAQSVAGYPYVSIMCQNFSEFLRNLAYGQYGEPWENARRFQNSIEINAGCNECNIGYIMTIPLPISSFVFIFSAFE